MAKLIPQLAQDGARALTMLRGRLRSMLQVISALVAIDALQFGQLRRVIVLLILVPSVQMIDLPRIPHVGVVVQALIIALL